MRRLWSIASGPERLGAASLVGQTALRGSSRPFTAVIMMIFSGLFLSIQDGFAKWLTGELPVGEVMCLRGLFFFLPIILLIWRQGGLVKLKTRRLGGHLARGMLVVVSMGLFLSGLKVLPLVTVVAIGFTTPLFATALAVPMLKERVGRHRWAAVTIGFAGVLVIMQPADPSLRLALLLPLAATLIAAIRDILTRALTPSENTAIILFYSNCCIVLGGLTTLPFAWKTPSLADLGLLAAAGVLQAAAHYTMVQAFRYGEIGLVSPFRYVVLIWVALIGYLVWGDIPGLEVLAGSTLVIISGIYVLHRERRQNPVDQSVMRQQPPTPPKMQSPD